MTTDNLLAVADGSEDPDGEGTVSYRYVWFEDGVEDAEVTGAEYLAERTAKGRTPASMSTRATTPTRAHRPLLSAPSTPGASGRCHRRHPGCPIGTEVTCLATGTDADDAITITDVWSDGSIGSTYTVPAGTPVDTVLTLHAATLDDGDAMGTTTATATLTVTNTGPEMTSYPGRRRQHGWARPSRAAEATDEDGDEVTLSFAWSDGSTGAEYTLDSEDDPGEQHDHLHRHRHRHRGRGRHGQCERRRREHGTDRRGREGPAVTHSPGGNDARVQRVRRGIRDGRGASTSSRTAGRTPASASEGPTYVVAESDDPGETITCTATATDADGGSASDTGTVPVENTDPALASVTVSPLSAKVGESLTCAAVATDADGGSPTITYTWSAGALGSTRGGVFRHLSRRHHHLHRHR